MFAKSKILQADEGLLEAQHQSGDSAIVMPTPNTSFQVHNRNQDIACDLARGNKHKGATKLETAGVTRAAAKLSERLFRTRIRACTNNLLILWHVNGSWREKLMPERRIAVKTVWFERGSPST